MSNKFHILIVDDDIGDVELIQEFLSEDTYAPTRLYVAADGVEAMEYLHDQLTDSMMTLPDLILLDLNMPRKDGRELLNELKRQARLKAIPVVVFTTSDAPDDIDAVYELGGNAFVTKPAGLDKFEEVVDSIKTFWIKTNKGRLKVPHE